MRAITYMIYIIFYESLCLGGCAYLVFWRGINPWWWVLGVFMSVGAYRPKSWAALFGAPIPPPSPDSKETT